MARATGVQIDLKALMHNLNRIKQCAPNSKIFAMVKANAYGCGLSKIAPMLEGKVDAFGVACLEEASALRTLGLRTPCILFQGLFSPNELAYAQELKLQMVIHQACQLRWLLERPLSQQIKIWVKVNTGMHRLGFAPHEIYDVLKTLQNCPWVEDEIGLMTHLACADEPHDPRNQAQLQVFNTLHLPPGQLIKSIANSAAIIALPQTLADAVRPGIMLYGVSPFAKKTGLELGLLPVMHFVSFISAIHHYPAGAEVGYGGIWQTKKPSIIGVVAAGYGDGYPRHISSKARVWLKTGYAPIVGRVSMDMLTIDLTNFPQASVGDPVELWGMHLPVELVASSAGTIAYELLCQFSPRPCANYG